MFRTFTIFVVGFFLAISMAQAAGPVESAGQIIANRKQREAERESIEQTPLKERPNRPGHFYGNNVRRVYYGKVRVNQHRGVQGPLGF